MSNTVRACFQSTPGDKGLLFTEPLETDNPPTGDTTVREGFGALVLFFVGLKLSLAAGVAPFLSRVVLSKIIFPEGPVFENSVLTGPPRRGGLRREEEDVESGCCTAFCFNLSEELKT